MPPSEIQVVLPDGSTKTLPAGPSGAGLAQPFTPEDLEAIEKKMAEVTKADYPFTREEVSRAEAKKRFTDDPLKLERIGDLKEGEVISVYTDGPFVDLCRGPHVPSTGRIKHFKLLHAAGAYWRGDERSQMLDRKSVV